MWVLERRSIAHNADRPEKWPLKPTAKDRDLGSGMATLLPTFSSSPFRT